MIGTENHEMYLLSEYYLQCGEGACYVNVVQTYKKHLQNLKHKDIEEIKT